MTDPLNIALSLGASAVDDTSKEAAKLATSLWMKVLGPPADALGGHLKARMEMWSQDALARRVLNMAAKKTNMDIPGSVPPRVAAQVLDQARWSDDEFIAEYLSGVLASSRTADASDDSGVAWAALVGRLPALALRLHFVLYRAACDVLQGTRMKSLESLRGTRIVIGYHELWETLERTTLWDQTRVLEAFSLLQREKLVEERSRYGSLSYVGEVYPKSTQELARRQASARVTGALVFEPTWHGAQFFMWGVGEGARGPLHWINDAAARDFSSSLPAAKGAFLSLDDVPDIIVDGGKP